MSDEAPGATAEREQFVQITPAMIAAGVYAAKECCMGEGLESLVFKVFMAMRTEELDSR